MVNFFIHTVLRVQKEFTGLWVNVGSVLYKLQHFFQIALGLSEKCKDISTPYCRDERVEV